MSWPDGTSQPQQARLAQALHDFGDATDQAVRAWAGQLTMRQAFDITYVLTGILRRLDTTAERLSRYGRTRVRVGDLPFPHWSGFLSFKTLGLGLLFGSLGLPEG